MNHHRLIRSAALGLALAALAAPTAAGVDLRSPDARDAARAAEARQDPPYVDLRSPDARDAGEGRAGKVTVVTVTERSPASDGLDWADVGIGAGGLLGLILLGLGGTFVVLHRRQASPVGRQTATTG